ncbi:uncharacterized protein JCM6883_005680 [Sporobolomyces salmoneus]|uniref:uncharacterized protein n=1 Tax=Sporobolomyces salmoneus TaxID=183962 RepID=UPI00317AA53E
MSKRQKTVLSDEPVLQRIHVGGLAPSVTPRELVARFSSFGEIRGGSNGIEGLGITQSGLPRNYAFFDLLTSQAKLQRCMSMLNGSMWKSHKLRIGPAKPNWEQRRAEERRLAREAEEASSVSIPTANADGTTKKRKRKLSSDPNVGYTAKRFEIVTPDNIENHKGWILDSKPHSSVPLFPLVVRPSHPIYLPPKAATTSWSRGKSSDEKKKKQREKELREQEGGQSIREKKPLIRIKRIRIDPRKYGRKKTVYSGTEATGGDTMTGVGHWECLTESENEDEEEGEPGERRDHVSWVFKTSRTGEIKQQETVKLNHRDSAHTDQFKALLEKLQIPECSKPPLQSQSPSKPSALSSTFPVHVSSTSRTTPASAPTSPPMTSARARSLSPPPYIPSAPRQLLYSEEDAFQLRVSSLDEQTREMEAQQERERLVRLAMGFLDEVPERGVVEPTKADEKELKRVLPRVEGFANDQDDSEDEDLFRQQAAMRLRGGGGVSNDSDSDSDTSSDEEEGKETAGGDTTMREDAAKAKTTLAKESLKDMFKPQEEQAASFSLFSGLELDIDNERERSPSVEAVSIPIPSALPPPPPRILPVYLQQQRHRQDLPVEKGPGYALFGLLDGEENTIGDARRRENEKRLKESGVEEWWKSQSQEEIDEAHAKLRESLRGFSRKRHRESVKRTKKKGSGGRDGGRRGGASASLGAFTLDSLVTAHE